MPIRRKIYKCGDQLEVEIYPISLQEQKKSRAKKKKESRKEQRNLNDKNARKNLRRRIDANFSNGDLIGHFSYDEKHLPSSEEEAIKDRNNFIRRLKNHRKKKGLDEIKYIAVLEYSEKTGDGRTKTRIHHHVIMSCMDRDDVEKLWGKGRANVDRLQSNEVGFEELANYLSKDPKGKKRWSQSKNIIIPEAQINDYEISIKKYSDLTRNGDREDYEKMYPGYIYTKQKIEFNEINGHTYIYVKMRRQWGGSEWKGILILTQ